MQFKITTSSATSDLKYEIKEEQLHKPKKCIKCNSMDTTLLILSTKEEDGKTLIESNSYCIYHKEELKNYLKKGKML